MDKELFNQQRVKIVGVHHIVPKLVHNDEEDENFKILIFIMIRKLTNWESNFPDITHKSFPLIFQFPPLRLTLALDEAATNTNSNGRNNVDCENILLW